MYEILSKLYDSISISKKIDCLQFVNKPKIINFDTISKENYDIIPDVIRKHIDSLKKRGRLYSFQLNGRNINLYIILPIYSKKQKTRERIKPPTERKTRNNNRKTNADFYYYYKTAFSILHFLNGQHTPQNTNCSTDLSIYLYLTDFKKTLPSVPGNDIGELNVNTGYTFGCSLKNDIYIFRKEEWDKVFIHETIHAFGFDFASHTGLNATANRRIMEFFKITKEQPEHDLRLYEAYTETWATILNILFQIRSVKQIPKEIRRQQEWSLNQYIKVMKYYKLDESTAIENEHRLILREPLTLYSYYILKCRLLLSIDTFFQYCSSLKFGSNEPTDLINFVKSTDAINKYMEFIEKTVYGGKQLETELLKLSENGGSNPYFTRPELRNSLRMTL